MFITFDWLLFRIVIYIFEIRPLHIIFKFNYLEYTFAMSVSWLMWICISFHLKMILDAVHSFLLMYRTICFYSCVTLWKARKMFAWRSLFVYYTFYSLKSFEIFLFVLESHVFFLNWSVGVRAKEQNDMLSFLKQQLRP